MNRENRAYWWRAIGLWFVLMAAETLNGLWRAKVLVLWIGDAAARDVSVFTGSIVILLITFACIGWIPAHSVMGAADHRLRIHARIRRVPPLAWGHRVGL